MLRKRGQIGRKTRTCMLSSSMHIIWVQTESVSFFSLIPLMTESKKQNKNQLCWSHDQKNCFSNHQADSKKPLPPYLFVRTSNLCNCFSKTISRVDKIQNSNYRRRSCALACQVTVRCSNSVTPSSLCSLVLNRYSKSHRTNLQFIIITLGDDQHVCSLTCSAIYSSLSPKLTKTI